MSLKVEDHMSATKGLTPITPIGGEKPPVLETKVVTPV